MAADTVSFLGRKIAAVTGGNRGIGLEICRKLAAHGVAVILTARDEKKGEAAAATLRGSGLQSVVFHPLDISDPSSVARFADFVKTKFGRLDILINNAAAQGTELPTEINPKDDMMARVEWLERNAKDTDAMVEASIYTNYFGTKNVTETLLPLLQLSLGTIVTVSSAYALLQYFRGEELIRELDDADKLTEERLDELARTFLHDFRTKRLAGTGWPSMPYSGYKTAKALISAYTRVIAKKYPELKINNVHPGFVKTDMSVQMGVMEVDEGAEAPVKAALSPEGTGLFYYGTKVGNYVNFPSE